MERDYSSTSPRSEKSEEGGGGRVGCGGCLKVKLPKVPINYLWIKSKNYIKKTSKNAATNVCVVPQLKKAKFHGDFRYDPLSYAQNFDEGVVEYDQDDYDHGFSSRYAALPNSKPTGSLIV
ncbi:hypothetical protein SOVF_013010 [Spinacia oleracea]|nr:hypothetical protein SOVF_013010 [Spinacia oleracea]